MANEPEKRIEQLLHCAARKRRDRAGPAFQLHPVNRRMLQGEVARRYHRPAVALPEWGAWLRLWPRLAWALGLAAVLGFLTLQLLPDRSGSRQLELAAQKDELSQEASRTVSPSADAAVAPPAAFSTAESLPSPVLVPERSAKRIEDTRVLGGPAPPVPSRPDSVSSVAKVRDSTVLASPKPASRTLGAAPETEAIAKFEGAPVATLTVPQTGPAIAGRFQNLEALKKAAGAVDSAQPTGARIAPASPAPGQKHPLADAEVLPVLNEFAVEQVGGEMQIVDADGSIYRGTLQEQSLDQAMPSGAGQVFLRSRAGEAAPAAAVQAPVRAGTDLAPQFLNAAQNYSFRVVGTNLSLKQKVVFTGNFVGIQSQDVLGTTNAVPTGQTQVSVEQFSNQKLRTQVQNQLLFRNQAQNLQNLPLQNQLAPARIAGKALVGELREIQVDALSQTPR